MKEFIKYLEKKDLAKITQDRYLRNVKNFFKWAKMEAEQVTKPDVLRYLEYLKNDKGHKNTSRKLYLNALNHYFTYLLKTEQISKNPCYLLKIRGTKQRTLYKIYTPEELDELFDNYYNVFVRNFDSNRQKYNYQRQGAELYRERNALVLNILVNQGATTGEVEKLEISDLDLIKATLKVQGGQHSNERTIPLKATQIGLIINYLQNIRPQMLDLPESNNSKLINKGSFRHICNCITKQLKTIDRQFINVQQIRASVITNWLKIHGLRKTQYLAGHKHVTSTETYLSNNLDNLIDDINKMHPFL